MERLLYEGRQIIHPAGFAGMRCPNACDQGIAATGMQEWAEAHGAQYIRFVYSNEPLDRLRGAGDKVRRALGC